MLRFDGIRRAVVGTIHSLASSPSYPLAFLVRAILGPIPRRRELTDGVQKGSHKPTPSTARKVVEEYKAELKSYNQNLEARNQLLKEIIKLKSNSSLFNEKTGQLYSLNTELKSQEEKLKKLATDKNISFLSIKAIPGVFSLEPTTKSPNKENAYESRELGLLVDGLSPITNDVIKRRREGKGLIEKFPSLADGFTIEQYYYALQLADYAKLLSEKDEALKNGDSICTLNDQIIEKEGLLVDLLENESVEDLGDNYHLDFAGPLPQEPIQKEYDELGFDNIDIGWSDEDPVTEEDKPSSKTLNPPITLDHIENLVRYAQNLRDSIQRKEEEIFKTEEGFTTQETGSNPDSDLDIKEP